MNILVSFQNGLKEMLKHKRLLIFLWALNSFVALLFVLPAFFLFRQHLARSLAAEDLARGINLVSLGDLVYRYQHLTPFLIGQMFALFLIAVIMSTVATAGIFGAFSHQAPYHFPDIAAAAGRYFFRFFRLFLLFIVCLLFILVPFSRSLAALFQLWTTKANSAWPIFWSGLIKIIILLALYSMLKTFFDFTKVFLVYRDSRRVLRSLGGCASFLSRRFWRAWAVFLLSSLASSGLVLVFFFICRFISTTPLWAFWLVFGLQQIYVFLRGAGKVLTFASCYHFSRLELEKGSV